MTSNGWTRAAGGLLLLASLALNGCGNFFVDPTSTGGGTGGGAGTGNYVYVLNKAVSSTTGSLSAYTISSAGLTQLAGSPIALTTSALSVAVSRPNTFVFVGSQGAIGCYTINTDGTLTASTTGGASLPSAVYSSIVTSPIGSWLLALDTTQVTASVFSINTSTCALSLTQTLPFTPSTTGLISARSIRIAPTGTLVAVALGTAGNVFFTFNPTTGVLAQSQTVTAPAGATVSDVLFDPTSSFAFTTNTDAVSGQGTIGSFGVATNGSITVGSSVLSQAAPQSMVLYTVPATSATAATTYLYAASPGGGAAGSLSGYTVAGGTLTKLAASPFGSSPGVSALALDETGKYLVAANNVAPDLTLYGFDLFDPSKLISIAQISNSTTSTGTQALATTHGTGNLTAGN